MIEIICKCGASVFPADATPIVRDTDPDYRGVVCNNCATVIALPPELVARLRKDGGNGQE